MDRRVHRRASGATALATSPRLSRRAALAPARRSPCRGTQARPGRRDLGRHAASALGASDSAAVCAFTVQRARRRCAQRWRQCACRGLARVHRGARPRGLFSRRRRPRGCHPFPLIEACRCSSVSCCCQGWARGVRRAVCRAALARRARLLLHPLAALAGKPVRRASREGRAARVGSHRRGVVAQVGGGKGVLECVAGGKSAADAVKGAPLPESRFP